MHKRKRKQALTLVETMIVIFIIGMISSVVGVNMRKSFEKGKHFKTKQAITKLYNIIEIELAHDPSLLEQSSDKGTLNDLVAEKVRGSHFIKNTKEALKDGWGKKFKVNLLESGEVAFTSEPYETYCNKHNLDFDYPWSDDEYESS